MFASYGGEDTNTCNPERKPWAGCHTRPLDDLEGTWVNVDCPVEQYMVQGHNVTRTDLRGTHHFTLHWDYERERWQWGTHGRLSLEWLGDDVISWVPDVHAQHAKVWHWRRSGPPPLRHGAVVPPPVLAVSNYGPVPRRPRTSASHHQWAQPYPTSSGQWCMPSTVIPPRTPFLGSSAAPTQWLQRGWDFIDDGQQYHHYHHDRYQREYQHRDHGYYNWRARSHGYFDFGIGSPTGSLPCGLSNCEVSDLMYREITPEDYDLLCRLDKATPKPTASAASIECLPVVHQKEFMGGECTECTVCLSKFEAHDSVVALPCQHRFHRSCVAKWLSECRRMCPLCGVEVLQAGQAATHSSGSS